MSKLLFNCSISNFENYEIFAYPFHVLQSRVCPCFDCLSVLAGPNLHLKGVGHCSRWATVDVCKSGQSEHSFDITHRQSSRSLELSAVRVGADAIKKHGVFIIALANWNATMLRSLCLSPELPVDCEKAQQKSYLITPNPSYDNLPCRADEWHSWFCKQAAGWSTIVFTGTLVPRMQCSYLHTHNLATEDSF